MCFILIVWYVREDIRFWSFMSSDYVGELHFINGIMNAEDYVKILNENMSCSFKRLEKRLMFQHDNDKKHSVKKKRQFLKSSKINLLEWAIMSADLNPTEHFANVLKQKKKTTNIQVRIERVLPVRVEKKIPVTI